MIDRMVKRVYPAFAEVRTKAWKKVSATYSAPYDVIGSEDTVVGDRIVKKSVVKTRLPQEQFKGLKASDFYLENILAAGAVDMLKPVQFVDNGLDNVDKVGFAVDDVINAIDNSMPKNNDEE